MALSQPTIPNFNVQQPDVMQNYAKMVSLQNMLAQQKELPLDLQIKQQQVQQEQQQTQQQTIATQQAQLQQQSQAAMVKALSDPDFGKEIGTSGTAPSGNGLGFDPDAMTQGLIKRGVLPQQALLFTSSLVDRSEKVSEATKNNAAATSDAIGNYSKGLDAVSNLIAPILDMPASEAGQAFQNFKTKLATNPIPGMSPQDLQVITGSTLEQLPAVANFLGIEGRIADYHKTQADALKGTAGATQAARAAAAPSVDQLKTATDTVNSYTSLPAPMKAAFVNELSGAPDWESLQKVQARADSAEQSEGMKQATLAQAKAMMGDRFAETGLTANEKIWTDPQRGFAGALAQANQTKASIVAGANGNALLTNMIPTMEVLGINHAGGINRISPAEAEAAGVSPDWATRWNAWASKSMTGKLTPELAKQGNQLMDVVVDAAYGRAVTSSQLIAKGHNIDPSQTPAMTKTGEITSLDQVAGKSGTPALIFARDAQGVLHSAPSGTALPKGWTLEEQSAPKKESQ